MTIDVDWPTIEGVIRREKERRAEKHRAAEEREVNRNLGTGRYREDGSEIMRDYKYISVNNNHRRKAQQELDAMTE